MKIKEFSILRFGPLSAVSCVLPGIFTLFFGRNEDGKTLTIDALVKLLLGKKTKEFDAINRVEETPSGYVIVEDEQAGEWKLPDKGDLTAITGLTPWEYRNIFIIRNSDLAMTREDDFFTSVVDRLSGLRTREISVIKDTLREMGKLTPSGDLRDIKEEKLKTRVDKARVVHHHVKELRRSIQERGVDRLEEEIALTEEKLAAIRDRLANLDAARKGEKYRLGVAALSTIKTCMNELKPLTMYNPEDERRWRDHLRSRESLRAEKERLVNELKEREEALKEAREILESAERRFDVLEDRKKRLDNEIKPALTHLENLTSKVAAGHETARYATVAALLSSLLLGVGFVAVFYRPDPLWYAATVFFGTAAACSIGIGLKHLLDRVRVARQFSAVALALARYGLAGENLAAMVAAIQAFDDEYGIALKHQHDIRRRVEHLEENITRLHTARIPETDKGIETYEAGLDELRRSSRVTTVDDYAAKLEQKRTLEGLLRERQRVLESHFPSAQSDFTMALAFWENELKGLAAYKEAGAAVDYSETALTDRRNEENSLLQQLGTMRQETERIRKDMDGVERDINDVLRTEGSPFPCQTSVDLDAAANALETFVNEHEAARRRVTDVLNIFDMLEAEERKKVTELFGEQSTIARYFREITDGTYVDVRFDEETGQIIVMRSDGAPLNVRHLSAGTYDQLYFAVRLALGEQLLNGATGFFILDDPFIKADQDRLHHQIDMLRKMVNWGWQILLFSAKSEVVDTLQDDISAGSVELIRVEAPAFPRGSTPE